MWLTFAVLMGTLINPATTASLPALTGANSGTQAAAEKDKKVLNEKLVKAVMAGDAETTRALLRNGADVNDAWGSWPLAMAAQRNDLAIAGILIDAGAKVDNLEMPDSSPLTMAVLGDHEEMLRFLLAHGAKVNGAGPGSSPLSRALGSTGWKWREYLLRPERMSKPRKPMQKVTTGRRL